MQTALLHDIGVALVAATGCGLLAHWLRQPVLLGYLVAGALIGPIGLNAIQTTSITVLSEIGLVLLMFIIGLELDPRQLAREGRRLLITGFMQFPLCVVLGLLAFLPLSLGAAGLGHLYLAIAAAMSSTAIVVKVLADKVELDTIPGRMTVGVLVAQDLFAILLLAFQPSLNQPALLPVAKALGATLVLVTLGVLAGRYLLKGVFRSIASTPELVVATALGWCAAMAAMAGMLNLSMAMGALIAGMGLASAPYRLHVTAKVLPLRDVFLTLFFVSLSMQIDHAPTWDLAGPVLLVVAVTVLTRFLSVYPLLVATGAGRRTAFITSLNLAQVSEFSLVICALGVMAKHIDSQVLGVVIYAMAITAVGSTYAIRASHRLFQIWDGWCARSGLGRGEGAFTMALRHNHHPIAVLGVHRTARAFLDRLGRDPARLRQVMVIDFNTEVLRELSAQGIHAVFGDLASLDTLQHAHLEHARLVLLTIPDMLLKGTDNLRLVQACRALAREARLIAVADTSGQAEQLRQVGADIVLMPHEHLGRRLVELVDAETGSR